MSTISSDLLSPSWLSSVSYPSHQDKGKLNDTVKYDRLIIEQEKTSQINSLQLKEEITSAENLTKATTEPYDNHLATFLLTPSHQITMTLPHSETAFFLKSHMKNKIDCCAFY